MKNGKDWLKEQLMGLKFNINEFGKVRLGEVFELVDQLDEPEKVVIPQFVAKHIEASKKTGDRLNVALSKSPETGMVKKMNVTISEANNIYARAWLDGYEVEKEISWEIPMPNLKTSDGHIQYLTYDPKARTYFAARKNERLKQTFNTKDFASVPEQYRRYAELCGFKKIEEVTE